MNQQAWLEAGYSLLRERLLPLAPPLEEVVISYGWPSRGARKKQNATLGECWGEPTPPGKRAAIFISPAIWCNPFRVLDVLLHEMIHAALPLKVGHKGEFKRKMKEVGLSGKATATVAGEELAAKLQVWLLELPDFPGAGIEVPPSSKKGSRLRLWICNCDKPIKVRVASDSFEATCNLCNEEFRREESHEG